MIDLGIVMPVYYQKESFLQEALASVLNQSFRNYKLVIVIDGANEMEPLVKKYTDGDARVEIVVHSENRGVAEALNTGFRKLLRDKSIVYLTWVSSDNSYYPTFLETLRSTLVKGPDELGIAYSSFQTIDNDGKPKLNERQLAAQRLYQGVPKEKLLDASIIGVSFMYKAKYARMIDGYGMVPVEDYDYWLRLSEYCEIKYIPVELMDYRAESTFSVSASLKSIEKHRLWRYKYHLTRHLARHRRGIKPQVTIIYPLRYADQGSIARIENLYEQAFSNYVCYVLDLSMDQQVKSVLGTISHPSTDFKWFPNVGEQEALMYAVQMILTPYTMIIGPNGFPNVMDIDVLVRELDRAAPEAISNFYTADHQAIGYRFSSAPSVANKHDAYNELYRTNSLIEILRQILK